jgi:hypothetical protein
MRALQIIPRKARTLPALRIGVVAAFSVLLIAVAFCPVPVFAMGQDPVWSDYTPMPMDCPLQAAPCATIATAFQFSLQHLQNLPVHEGPVLGPDPGSALSFSPSPGQAVPRDRFAGSRCDHPPLYLLHASLIR